MSVATAAPRPAGSLLDDLECLEEPVAAAEIGIKPQTLIGYRKRGVGPAYSVVARKIIYTRPNLRAWLAAGGTRAKEMAD